MNAADLLNLKLGRSKFFAMNLGSYIAFPILYRLPDLISSDRLFDYFDGVEFAGDFGSVIGSSIPLSPLAEVFPLSIFTIAFSIFLAIITLWRCNDSQADKRWILAQFFVITNIIVMFYLSIKKPPRIQMIDREDY